MSKITKIAQEVAGQAAEVCNKNAKSTGGWRRWLWAAGAVIAAAVAWFTGSTYQQQPEQVGPMVEQEETD